MMLGSIVILLILHSGPREYGKGRAACLDDLMSQCAMSS